MNVTALIAGTGALASQEKPLAIIVLAMRNKMTLRSVILEFENSLRLCLMPSSRRLASSPEGSDARLARQHEDQ